MAFLEELRNSMGGGSPTKGAAKSVDPNDLTDLGLGGLPSFFGTREDAAKGKRGDAQIAATLTDSLPGYFNPETRDYVPWYVDLFDGGGINRSAGMLDAGSGVQSQTVGGSMSAMQPQGLLANNQLSDMEMANRNRVGVDPRNLGGAEGYGPLSARDPRNLGGAEGYGPIPTYASTQQGILPQDYAPAERYASSQQGIMPQMQDNMPVSTPAPRESTLNTLRENVYSVGPIEAMINAYKNRQETPPAQSSPTQVPAPAQSGQSVPASGGNMAINTPAAQGRDQMISDQMGLQEINQMQGHPLYQSFTQSPFGEGDKKYYPTEFFKYLQAVGG